MKASNKSYFIGVALVAALIFLAFTPKKIPLVLEKKMHAAIQSVYGGATYELKVIEVAHTLKQFPEIESEGDILYEIQGSDGSTLGYAYLGHAPSMKNIFDYLVILEPDLRIKKTKVLIYREDYGRQIGSQRWLKQFIGVESGVELKYGEEIDAISGATISAKSMTRAINGVLSSMHILRDKKII